MPLEVRLVDTESARQRLEEMAVSHGQMAALNRTLRSNRSVNSTSSHVTACFVVIHSWVVT